MDPFSKEGVQQIRQDLAEQGLEMTPDEVRQYRKVSYAELRATLQRLGYTPPEDDEEMYRWLQECLRPNRGEPT